MRRRSPWRGRNRTAVFSPGGLPNCNKPRGIKIKSSTLLSIFAVCDDYKMKIQCAKLCCWPEDRYRRMEKS
jgi:hypothetical protein